MTVIVVGAGPTGLTLACQLMRHGVPCRLVDASSGQENQSKALAIWPRTLEMMDRVGVAAAAIDSGLPLTLGVIHSNHRPLARLEFDALRTRYPFGLILPQSETERILSARLEELGGQVERQTEFVDAEEGETTLHVALKRGDHVEKVEAQWLVGCDGANSAVRTWAGIPFAGKPYSESFLLADVMVRSSLPRDRAQYFLSPAGLLHAVPLPSPGEMSGALSPWRFTFDIEPSDACSDLPSITAIESEVARRGLRDVRIASVLWKSRFRIQRRLVARYRQGRCLLAGDAAHVHSPAGGQGINTGVQDAMNLAWKLAFVDRELAHEDLLDSYESERMPIAHKVAHHTNRATRLGMVQSRSAVALRDAAAMALYRMGVYRRLVIPALAGLADSYAGSPIVVPRKEDRRLLASLGQTRRPKAGDRAPDPTVDAPPAWSSSAIAHELVDALRSPHHVALFFRCGEVPDPREHAAAEVLASALPDMVHIVQINLSSRDRDGALEGNALVDPDGHCHSLFGATRPSLYLIRPDGYIALRSMPLSVPDVCAFTTKVLAGRARSNIARGPVAASVRGA
jgi:2-polyprenyl-6-methoxyphenol hydroxylase-like FAD-dependent oxidoreductase